MQMQPQVSRLGADGWPLLLSPFAGVNDEQWTALYGVLSTTNEGEARAIDYRGSSGTLGMFAINPRRLVDIGFAVSVRKNRSVMFKLPYSEAKFLANPILQRTALIKSLKLYYEHLTPPTGMSRSGALALLHCVNSIEAWQKRPLVATMTLFKRAEGIF